MAPGLRSQAGLLGLAREADDGGRYETVEEEEAHRWALMVAVVSESSGKLVLRHWSLSWAGVAALTCVLTGLGVAFDASRTRVSLSCVRHETDPSHPHSEDIDCTMVRNAVRSSFELGRVSVLAVHQRMGGHMSHEPKTNSALYFDVLLHRPFPREADGMPLFRFPSREAAEQSGGQLEMWMKDASISDDDVDEIDLDFGPPVYGTWLLVCGGALALIFAAQPLVEVVSFDAPSNTFVLTRRNLVGIRTEEICHPIDSIARAAVSEQLVSLSGGGAGGAARGRFSGGDNGSAATQKAQRLSVLLRSWAVGDRSYGDTFSADGGGDGGGGGGGGSDGVGIGRAGLEIPLAMGELLFDPIGVSKTAGRVQRFLCDHLPPGYNPDDLDSIDAEGRGGLTDDSSAERTHESGSGDGSGGLQHSDGGSSWGSGGGSSGLGAGGRLRPCCACMEAAPDCVLLPCGHLNTCERCARQCERCPSCRQRVEKIQRVYF